MLNFAKKKNKKAKLLKLFLLSKHHRIALQNSLVNMETLSLPNGLLNGSLNVSTSSEFNGLCSRSCKYDNIAYMLSFIHHCCNQHLKRKKRQAIFFFTVPGKTVPVTFGISLWVKSTLGPSKHLAFSALWVVQSSEEPGKRLCHSCFGSKLQTWRKRKKKKKNPAGISTPEHLS